MLPSTLDHHTSLLHCTLNPVVLGNLSRETTCYRGSAALKPSLGMASVLCSLLDCFSSFLFCISADLFSLHLSTPHYQEFGRCLDTPTTIFVVHETRTADLHHAMT